MIADGYARGSGKPGVVISAGETIKLVTGTTSAWADKTPLIVVSICPDDTTKASPIFDREGLDMKEVFKPISRFRARVSKPEEISIVYAVI